jgi:hypothetical protein
MRALREKKANDHKFTFYGNFKVIIRLIFSIKFTTHMASHLFVENEERNRRRNYLQLRFVG